MSEPNARPTPEHLARIRGALSAAPTGSYLFANTLLVELDAVTRERDEARKDKARLDWMQEQGHSIEFEVTGQNLFRVWNTEGGEPVATGIGIRAAIDEARGNP